MEPLNLRYDQMTPLDRALDSYSKQAKKYFDYLNDAENAPPEIREARKQKLKEAKTHLDNERRIAETIGDVQAQLEMYREQGRNMNSATLNQEKHHPTGELEKFMRAVPVPKPSEDHTAHHIVPGKGKTPYANRARIRMHLFGIRINDPDNGVWLPRYKENTPHWSMPKSKGHLEYHTYGYESWVNRKLQTKSSDAAIRQELQLIGSLLQQNRIPPEARGKK